MKTRTGIIFSFCLILFCAWVNPVDAALKVEVQGDKLSVETDQSGVGGLQGCEEEKLREVPAFIFNLYRLDRNKSESRGDEEVPCEEDTRRGWRIFSQKPGIETGKMDFTNLPSGDYKVVVYYGKAEGCDLSTFGQILSNHPHQAIVYKKDSAENFSVGGSSESLAMENSRPQNLRFKVYPNPAKDQVSIEIAEGILTSNIKITVFDLLGRSLIDSNTQAGLANCDYQCQLDVSDLSSGAYLIKIQDKDGQLLHQEKMMVIKD